MEVARMGMKDLFPFRAHGFAILEIEKSALGGFEKKLVRAVAICEEVGIEFSENHLRGQQVAGTADVAVLQICLKSALVQVRSACLGSKGVQAVIIKLLREDRERCRRGLLLADVHVHLRVGVKALQPGIALEWRQTV